MNINYLYSYTSYVFNIVLLAAFTTTVIYAQPVIDWDKTYGGNIWEELNSIIVTDDDGYFMSGFTSSTASGDVSGNNFGGGDFWIVKSDNAGNKLWDKRFGGDSLDRIWKAVFMPGDGYLLAGESRSNTSGVKTAAAYGHKDFWVLKTDLNGNYLWDRSFGGTGEDWLLTAAPAPGGGCLLGGWSDSAPHAAGSKTAPHKGDVDIWLVMIDHSGQVVWDKSYGGIQMEQLHHVQLLNDGNYLLAGSSASGICPDKSQASFGSLDYWILKINPLGEIIWEKSFGGTEEDVAIVVKEATNGDLYVGGGSKSGINGTKTTSNLGDADYWLLKLNASGEEIYQKRFGGGNLDKLYAIDITKNNYVLVGGISGSGTNTYGQKNDDTHGNWDMWILYLDPAGEYVWDKVVGGSDQDALTDIVRVKDGSFALVGNSQSNIGFEKTENSKGMNDFWLVKTFCDSPVEIRGDSSGCQYEEITLDITVDSCIYCTYTWSNGSHEASVTVLPDENFSMLAYVVDRRGCESVDSFFVTVFEKPHAAAFELTPPLCFGEGDGSIRLLGIEGGTSPYLYSFEAAPFTPDPNLLHLYSGEYEFAVTDFYGCSFDTIVRLEEPEAFVINLGQDTIINLGDSLQILPTANYPVADYLWDHPAFNNLTPWIQPTAPESFFITAWNENGCESEDHLTIYIRIEKEYFAPNIFSPNGDGNNDVFTIFAGKNTVAIRNLTIFDRWGNQLYFNDEVFPGAEIIGGWDGYYNGQLLENGIYIYHAEIGFIDGSWTLAKGDVAIVR